MAKLSQAEIDTLKAKLPEYLSRHGIHITGDKNIACISGSHSDKTPSMSYNNSGHYLKCFSCDAHYDTFSACELMENLSQGQGINRIKEIYGYGQSTDSKPTSSQTIKQPKQHQAQAAEQIPDYQHTTRQPEQPQQPQTPVRDFRDVIEQAHANLASSEYHRRRGISDEVAKRFKLGYTNSNGMNEALVIPLKRLDGTYSYQQRNTDTEAPKEKRHYKPASSIGGTGEIFNQEVIGNTDKPIFVTEGALDALSIIQAGGEAVAINGVGTSKLIELLGRHKDKHTIILSLDNDEAGRNAQAKLKEQLKIVGVTSHDINVSFNKKDANEALATQPDNFAKVVRSITDEKQAKAKAYLQRTVESNISDFWQFVNTKRPPAISTGFSTLDKTLRGGLREGLYCIGGISSLGKTTLALQIMDNIAKQGRDVLIFSLEMGSHELRAKTIARESYQIDDRHAVTTLEVLDRQLREQLMPEQQKNSTEAMQAYWQYVQRVHIHEAVGRFTVNDIKKTVEEHIEATGRTPVVLVDYLQILQPADAKLSDKAKVSYDVYMLKQLSRDKHTPVMVISSFNRGSYGEEASFSSFKESGEIEYTADVLLALQLTALRTGTPTEEALEEAYRQIDVKVLKNRNGTLGIASFKARLAHNHFKQMDAGELQEVKEMIANKQRREQTKKAKTKSY